MTSRFLAFSVYPTATLLQPQGEALELGCVIDNPFDFGTGALCNLIEIAHVNVIF